MNHSKSNRYHFTEEDLCLNCYRTGHHRYACPNQGIIACSICFMSNVFTKNCNCKNPQKPRPRQTLRFVKDHLMFVDVEIHGREFPALINTSSKITKIGNTVLNWLLEVGYSSKEEYPSKLTIPILTHGQPIELSCKVQRFLENHLELGTDFLTRQGFKFQLGNIQLDSHLSPIMESPKQYEYLYSMRPWGSKLQHYLDRKRSNETSVSRKRKIDANNVLDSQSPEVISNSKSSIYMKSIIRNMNPEIKQKRKSEN